jgi:hypothetical protein
MDTARRRHPVLSRISLWTLFQRCRNHDFSIPRAVAQGEKRNGLALHFDVRSSWIAKPGTSLVYCGVRGAHGAFANRGKQRRCSNTTAEYFLRATSRCAQREQAKCVYVVSQLKRTLLHPQNTRHHGRLYIPLHFEAAMASAIQNEE